MLKCRKCQTYTMEPHTLPTGVVVQRCRTCGRTRTPRVSATKVTEAMRRETESMRRELESKLHSITASTDRAELERIVQLTVEASIRRHLEALAAANEPQVIEVRHEKGPSAKVQGAHYLMSRVLRLLRAGFNLFLWGDAGTGKTTAALQAAEALRRKSEIDTLDPTTFRSMVQGYMTPEGEPVHTAFTRCWVEGKVYIADEIDNAPGHVQTLFNSALANAYAPLAWGNVPRHKNFRFIGTGNTPGRPTRTFPDRRPMSAAFADRLYFIHWPLDPAIEARAAGMAVPVRENGAKPTEVKPADWVRYVQAIREWAKHNCPTLIVTPRATLIGLEALSLGESWNDVSDALIFRGADEDIRHKALSAVGRLS